MALTFPAKPWVDGQPAYLVPGQLYEYDAAAGVWDYKPKAVLDSDFEVQVAEIDGWIDSETGRIQNIQQQIIALKVGTSGDLDSEIHERKAGDSDLQVSLNVLSTDHDSDKLAIYHDFLAADSDIVVSLNSVSTGLTQEIHDRAAADSDLQTQIDNLKLENDSDNLITRGDHDSDLVMTYHDFRAADSDIYAAAVGNTTNLDSEILARKSADSDLGVRIDVLSSNNDSDHNQIIHDYIAADSDLLVTVLNNNSALDSEILERKSGDSDLSVALASEIHDRAASDSDINVSLTQEIHDRTAGDSDLQVQVSALIARADSDELVLQDLQTQIDILSSNADSDVIAIAQLRRDADSDSVTIQRLKTEVDSDAAAIAKIRAELDSDVSSLEALWRDLDSEKVVRATADAQIIHDYQAADSDLYIAAVGNTAQLDSEILVRKEADSDLLIIINNEIHNRIAADSDFNVSFAQETHDRISGDSDLTVSVTVLRTDHDSDFAKELHDRLAGDSDLLVLISSSGLDTGARLDSEILERKSADSDLRIDIDSDVLALRSADSDIRVDVDSDFTNLTLNKLLDVSVDFTPTQGVVLSWDSDSEVWKASALTATLNGAVAQKVDTFYAVDSDESFLLTYYPVGDTVILRNGVPLLPGTYEVSGKEVTYSSAANGMIDSDDIIQAVYNYGTDIAFTASMQQLDEVDILTTPPVAGDVLVWQADSDIFRPQNLTANLEARLDSDEAALQFHNTLILSNLSRIAQLEADLDSETARVQDLKTTVADLQVQINNNDSDIAAVGFTVISDTAPTGRANTIWLNTNNGRLYWYDTTNSVYIELTTGA